MKSFRIHITQVYTIAILLLSISLHLVEPIQQKEMHNAFTSWLDAKVISEQNSDVKRLIGDLSSDTSELEEVIRKASEIISENPDDFEFPLSDDSHSDIFDVLIKEWEDYQNSNAGMGKAVLLEPAKTGAIQQSEAKNLSKSVKTVAASCLNNLVKVEAGWETFTSTTSQTPHLSGVAINAP